MSEKSTYGGPKHCPFGPHLQNYWNKLSVSERNMELDEQALYSLDVQSVAAQTVSHMQSSFILDAFCGAGGTTIAMASAGKSVTAVELDADRLAMAQRNVQRFGVADRVHFIHGDGLKVLQAKQFEGVYLDPPWGGPNYARRSPFTLSCFVPDGVQILSLALRLADEVVFKLPKNFAFNELADFPMATETIENKLNGSIEYYTAIFRVNT